MKAWQYRETRGALVLSDLPIPEPGPGQVRIRVTAAGVNPVDWKIAAVHDRMGIPLPVTAGCDIAGEIEQAGGEVDGMGAGDKVFAMVGLAGAFAEHVVVDASLVVRKPDDVSDAEAATVPLAALTALKALEASGTPLAGSRILIHNAAGGVGTMATQIARAAGAHVVATASAANADFVREQGAHEVFDAREGLPDPAHEPVDALIDLVGQDLDPSLVRLIREGGRIVRVAGGGPPGTHEEGHALTRIFVRPDGARLARIAGMMSAGDLRPSIAATFPFAEAPQALALSKAGHSRGKIVLTL